MHLSHDAPPVRLHGDLTDPECRRYLLVQPARDHTRHDLVLAPAERGIVFVKRPRFGLSAAFGLTKLDRAANGTYQNVGDEGLRQELARARPHRLHRHRNVAVTGDEDDRHVRAITPQSPLDFEPAEPGKRYIEYQAIRAID